MMERLSSKRSGSCGAACAVILVAFLATLSFASTASAWWGGGGGGSDSYTWICHVRYGEEQSIRVTEYEAYKHLKYHYYDERGECEDSCDSSRDCRDGDYCTKAECLDDGSCDQGQVDCDDGNECTVNSCLSWKGCFVKDVLEGQSCVLDDPCMENTTCDADGNCVGTPVPGCCSADSHCNDGNGCTVDFCNEFSECESAPLFCRSTLDPCVRGTVCQDRGGDEAECVEIPVACNAGPCKTARCEVPDGVCATDGYLCIEEDVECPAGQTCDPEGSGECERGGETCQSHEDCNETCGPEGGACRWGDCVCGGETCDPQTCSRSCEPGEIGVCETVIGQGSVCMCDIACSDDSDCGSVVCGEGSVGVCGPVLEEEDGTCHCAQGPVVCDSDADCSDFFCDEGIPACDDNGQCDCALT